MGANFVPILSANVARVTHYYKIEFEKFPNNVGLGKKAIELIKDKDVILCLHEPIPPHSLTKELIQETIKGFEGKNDVKN